MNYNLIEENLRRAIVDDLLLRKPKGAKGVKPTYRVVDYYCYDACKEKNRVECDHPGWGYSDESIWDLGFRSECEVRDYIFKNFYKCEDYVSEYYLTPGRRAGITRKTNRVWGRIADAISRVKRAGNIPGLYQVSIGWRERFYFYGSSVEEVSTMANTMLSAIYPDQDITACFIDKSVPGDILDKNIAAFSKIEENVARLRKAAEESLEKARLAEEQASFVKTLVTQNLEVAMRAT